MAPKRPVGEQLANVFLKDYSCEECGAGAYVVNGHIRPGHRISQCGRAIRLRQTHPALYARAR